MANGLVDVVFPVGIFALLTGLFWIGDHGWYPRLYYWTVVLPTVLLITVQPGVFGQLLHSPIFRAFIPFAAYAALTVFWSTGEDSMLDMMKRPLYVLLLFLAVFELGRCRFERLTAAVKAAGWVSVVSAIYAVTLFVLQPGLERLSGYGAFRNPLLVSHVFGFFAALWLGVYFAERKLFKPLPIMAFLACFALLVATGSRTPLLAIAVALCWLAVLSRSRKAVLVIGVALVCGVLILLLTPQVVTQRGLSYRTDIWADALRQIGERLWFGHGYSSPIWIRLEGFPTSFRDTHNIVLSVLFAGGIVGFLFWMALYAVALWESWRLRADKWVLVYSGTVVYGLAASMTEGGSFLSRPKEHWFLIWIPLALLSATTYRARTRGAAAG